MERKQSDKPRDPLKPLNYPKDKLLHVMDEVLLDAVDLLQKYGEIFKEIQKENNDKSAEKIVESSEKLQQGLLEAEHEVCLLRGIDIEKYYEDVGYFDNNEDKDVKLRLDKLGKYIENAQKGEPIQVECEVAPELTKEMTLNLYKLLLTSHLHLHYVEVQKYLKDHPKATAEEISSVIEDNEEQKITRRNELLTKYKISKKEDQDYRVVLNSAYYSYTTHDQEFKKRMDNILKLNSSLMKMIKDKEIIPELKLDPATMVPALFEQFYNRLELKYINGVQVASLI